MCGATPASNLSKLCRIQNIALRVITETGWREYVPPLYATQKILQLSKLITYSVFKVLRSSGLMEEISTNSVSIRKLNG